MLDGGLVPTRMPAVVFMAMILPATAVVPPIVSCELWTTTPLPPKSRISSPSILLWFEPAPKVRPSKVWPPPLIKTPGSEDPSMVTGTVAAGRAVEPTAITNGAEPGMAKLIVFGAFR